MGGVKNNLEVLERKVLVEGPATLGEIKKIEKKRPSMKFELFLNTVYVTYLGISI